MNEVDLVLYNGTVISMDDNNSIYSWVAILDGKIVDLGNEDKYKKYLDKASDVVNLEGRTLLPGFYDSHVHLVQTGLNLLALDLSNATSIGEILEIIRDKANNTPKGELIRAIGFDELKIKEKRLPTRHELDCVAPNNPVWVNRVEYHTSSVNTMALHLLNLPFNLDGILRDERNIPDGRLTGKAGAMVRNHIFNNISDNVRSKGIHLALNYAIENGLTSINALEGGFTFHDKDAEFIWINKDKFPIDVTLFYQTVNLEKVINKRLKRIGGCIFLDGSFGSRTAALAEPYDDDKNTDGALYFNQEELNEFILNAHKKELQITVHAIGSRAIEQIICAYENAQRIYPRKNHRHRIEHFELPKEEHIERASNLNIILSMQPAYEYFWGNEGEMYETRLGVERSKKTNPLKNIVEKGLIIAGGSDSDVTPMNPILGIHAAVNHPVKDFSLDVLEALKLFTINGAISVFEEKIKGSIEIGKYGDFVILDKSPLEVDKKTIKDIRVVGTIKEGNILFIK